MYGLGIKCISSIVGGKNAVTSPISSYPYNKKLRMSKTLTTEVMVGQGRRWYIYMHISRHL